MSEIYPSIVVWALIGGALALFAYIAFDGLLGRTSPWRSQSPKKPENLKLNRLIARLDFLGLAITTGIFAWHFGVSALPDLLVWSIALPVAIVCIIGRAKAAFRSARKPQT